MDYLKPAKDLLSIINQNEIPELFVQNSLIELGNLPRRKILFPLLHRSFFSEKLYTDTFDLQFRKYTRNQMLKFYQAIKELTDRNLLIQGRYNEYNESYQEFLTSADKIYFPTLKGATWKNEITKPFWEVDAVTFLKETFENINIFLTSESPVLRTLIKKYA